MARGTAPVRTREASSPHVTSRMWCRASADQRFRASSASCTAPAGVSVAPNAGPAPGSRKGTGRALALRTGHGRLRRPCAAGLAERCGDRPRRRQYRLLRRREARHGAGRPRPTDRDRSEALGGGCDEVYSFGLVVPRIHMAGRRPPDQVLFRGSACSRGCAGALAAIRASVSARRQVIRPGALRGEGRRRSFRHLERPRLHVRHGTDEPNFRLRADRDEHQPAPHGKLQVTPFTTPQPPYSAPLLRPDPLRCSRQRSGRARCPPGEPWRASAHPHWPAGLYISAEDPLAGFSPRFFTSSSLRSSGDRAPLS